MSTFMQLSDNIKKKTLRFKVKNSALKTDKTTGNYFFPHFPNRNEQNRFSAL